MIKGSNPELQNSDYLTKIT